MIGKYFRKRSCSNITKQRGLTLIELGLAIAISATIIVVLLVALRATTESRRILETVNKSSDIMAAALRYGKSFTSATTSLVDNNYLEANVLQNPWSDSAAITATATIPNVTITIPDVTGSACQKMNGKWEASNLDVGSGSQCAGSDNGKQDYTITFNNVM